ncbi:hypothetical protein LY76DRAFT_413518 [Colletotrichum caudatum]|nr:hypothetical protein LY76DRAFT_413518 [Colletotrichum caudatum]
MLSDAKAVSSSLTLIILSFAVSTALPWDVGRRSHLFFALAESVLVNCSDSFNGRAYRFIVHVVEACANGIRHLDMQVGQARVCFLTRKTRRTEN